MARSIEQLVDYVKKTQNATFKAYTRALLSMLSHAEAEAKRNITRQFVGRNGRKLSGRMLNSVFFDVQFDASKGNLPIGVFGTRGIPYGRIHEYGGEIRPKKAKHLWLKQWGGRADKFRRMTPTEFIKEKNSNPKEYKIFMSKKNNLIAAYTPANGDIVPLFVLRQRVTIPERPYLRPALETALKDFPIGMKAQVKKQFMGIT
jgi:hypothetical protein